MAVYRARDALGIIYQFIAVCGITRNRVLFSLERQYERGRFRYGRFVARLPRVYGQYSHCRAAQRRIVMERPSLVPECGVP